MKHARGLLSSKDTWAIPSVEADPRLNLETMLRKGLRAMADGHLPAREAQTPRVRLPMIHASEISTCVRRAYYSAANVPKQDLVPHDTAMRFLQGHVMHELLQSALRQGALLTMEKHPELRIHFEPEIEVGETPLGKELNLHSSCDGVVTFEQLDQGEWSVLARIGVEFKTMAGSTWTKNASPQKEHIEQALVYMATLDLGMMWFAYVSKDNLAVTPFASPYNYAFDEAAWQQVRAKIETVIEAVKKRSAPEVKASSYCYSCTYKPICDPHKQDVVWRK